MEMNKLLEDYGCLTFSDDVMKERIPKSIYKAFMLLWIRERNYLKSVQQLLLMQ